MVDDGRRCFAPPLQQARQRALGETLLRGIMPSGRWGGELAGWLSVVQPALLGMAELPLTRVSDERIVVSLPAHPAYDITAPETLTLNVHPSLVLAEAPIVADPLVPIRAMPGVATLHGTLICAGGYYETYISRRPAAAARRLSLPSRRRRPRRRRRCRASSSTATTPRHGEPQRVSC